MAKALVTLLCSLPPKAIVVAYMLWSVLCVQICLHVYRNFLYNLFSFLILFIFVDFSAVPGRLTLWLALSL